MRNVLGPCVATHTGTRAAWRSTAGRAASTATRSPALSDRMVMIASSNAATVAGRLPMRRTAVSPTPMPNIVRPGSSRSTVAIDPAMTAGWRITGFSISVPRMMERVSRKACASNTYGSGTRSGEEAMNP